ncbi:hypothetical protein DDB_G0293716 [Dictyostelium discoideum AX4]|uniref:Uncharacterized protein n=1 Tax=Dictyostelium discoideum TaxID=44689 RepID=Q54BJ6_DICDI|nr:hypothetical protein DDB_G0293716 [Dictyostelium discoideum AX4]EAL60670.1 hypothetical protein DDB_G0293716 [Dictyostelium discoideum AX4]|eukprot:XP_629033.1 hypothetical protein DDB_G0293716 [Dictyostelium discoideum AX4]
MNINTLGGAISVVDTNVTIENSTFDSLFSQLGPSFFSQFNDNPNVTSSFNITNCVTEINYEKYLYLVQIVYSIITVSNTTLFFSIYDSFLIITNSTLISLLDQVNWLSEYQSIDYNTLTFSNSTVLFDSCTFGNDYTSIGCSLSSNVTFINSINFDPFYSCANCNHLIVDSNLIRDSKSVTTSTLIHHDSSNSLKLIPNIHSIIIFILLITTIIVS